MINLNVLAFLAAFITACSNVICAMELPDDNSLSTTSGGPAIAPKAEDVITIEGLEDVITLEDLIDIINNATATDEKKIDAACYLIVQPNATLEEKALALSFLLGEMRNTDISLEDRRDSAWNIFNYIGATRENKIDAAFHIFQSSASNEYVKKEILIFLEEQKKEGALTEEQTKSVDQWVAADTKKREQRLQFRERLLAKVLPESPPGFPSYEKLESFSATFFQEEHGPELVRKLGLFENIRKENVKETDELFWPIVSMCQEYYMPINHDYQKTVATVSFAKHNYLQRSTDERKSLVGYLFNPELFNESSLLLRGMRIADHENISILQKLTESYLAFKFPRKISPPILYVRTFTPPRATLSDEWSEKASSAIVFVQDDRGSLPIIVDLETEDDRFVQEGDLYGYFRDGYARRILVKNRQIVKTPGLMIQREKRKDDSVRTFLKIYSGFHRDPKRSFRAKPFINIFPELTESLDKQLATDLVFLEKDTEGYLDFMQSLMSKVLSTETDPDTRNFFVNLFMESEDDRRDRLAREELLAGEKPVETKSRKKQGVNPVLVSTVAAAESSATPTVVREDAPVEEANPADMLVDSGVPIESYFQPSVAAPASAPVVAPASASVSVAPATPQEIMHELTGFVRGLTQATRGRNYMDIKSIMRSVQKKLKVESLHYRVVHDGSHRILHVVGIGAIEWVEAHGSHAAPQSEQIKTLLKTFQKVEAFGASYKPSTAATTTITVEGEIARLARALSLEGVTQITKCFEKAASLVPEGSNALHVVNLINAAFTTVANREQRLILATNVLSIARNWMTPEQYLALVNLFAGSDPESWDEKVKSIWASGDIVQTGWDARIAELAAGGSAE